MAKTEPYDRFADRYDDWFSVNRHVYESELEAVRRMLPEGGTGIEIGVGTGRFAGPLDITMGVEPSQKMREIARKRGIEVISGIGEALPLKNSLFDFVLMVTVLCFLDDVEGSLREVHRVLKPSGAVVIGFIDRDTPIGKTYEERKEKSLYYKKAHFLSAKEVTDLLKSAGFKTLAFAQTIFQNSGEMVHIEPVREGHGEGCFAVVRAAK
ncbi:class I SAM-dependent methyltransferase [bacterium]|nr:MAG: class I SAM-dependent methyltransferase [bacterium]